MPSTNVPSASPTVDCRAYSNDPRMCDEKGCAYFDGMIAIVGAGLPSICERECRDSQSLDGITLGLITHQDGVKDCEQMCLYAKRGVNGTRVGCIAFTFDRQDNSCRLLQKYNELGRWHNNIKAKICVETSEPTVSPTVMPSACPISTEPSNAPSKVPTLSPTTSPTSPPTEAPSTSCPTILPTVSDPTGTPSTSSPTTVPTTEPSSSPSSSPTTDPTSEPTTSPTLAPTSSPTAVSNQYTVSVNQCEGNIWEVVQSQFKDYSPQLWGNDTVILLNRYHASGGKDLTATDIAGLLEDCTISQEELMPVGSCQDEPLQGFTMSCSEVSSCKQVDGARDSCCKCNTIDGGHGGSVRILNVKKLEQREKRVINLDATSDIDLSITGHSHWSMMIWVKGISFNSDIFSWCHAETEDCLKLVVYDGGFSFRIYTGGRRNLGPSDSRDDAHWLDLTEPDVLNSLDAGKHISIVVKGSTIYTYQDAIYKDETPIPADFNFTAREKATLVFGSDRRENKIEIGDVKYFKRDVQKDMMMNHYVETESQWVPPPPPETYDNECEDAEDCFYKLLSLLEFIWIPLFASAIVLFSYLQIFNKRARKLPCFTYLFSTYDFFTSLLFLWLVRSNDFYFRVTLAIIGFPIILTVALLHFIYLKRKHWGWWWLPWAFLCGGDIERCVGFFQSGFVARAQIFTDMSDNVTWKYPCKCIRKMNWTISVRFLYLVFTFFDVSMILWQIYWTYDTGRIARDFLISIFFSSFGLFVKLSVKIYKWLKGKYKFVDIYVYPWILQVNKKDDLKKGKPSQALSPDLWLLAIDLENYLIEKSTGMNIEVQISQNNYHNPFRIWGGDSLLAAQIEEFLNNKEGEEFEALHFLNHPHYETSESGFEFIAILKEDIQEHHGEHLPDAEYEDTYMPMAHITDEERRPHRVYAEVRHIRSRLTMRRKTEGFKMRSDILSSSLQNRDSGGRCRLCGAQKKSYDGVTPGRSCSSPSCSRDFMNSGHLKEGKYRNEPYDTPRIWDQEEGGESIDSDLEGSVTISVTTEPGAGQNSGKFHIAPRAAHESDMTDMTVYDLGSGFGSRRFTRDGYVRKRKDSGADTSPMLSSHATAQIESYDHFDKETLEEMMEIQKERLRLTEKEHLRSKNKQVVIVKEAVGRPKKDSAHHESRAKNQRARPLKLPLPLNSPEVSDDFTPSVFLRRSCTPEYSDDSLSAADSAIHIAKPKESRRLKASRVSLPAPRNSSGIRSKFDSEMTQWDMNSRFMESRGDDKISEMSQDLSSSVSQTSDSREYSTGSNEYLPDWTPQPHSQGHPRRSSRERADPTLLPLPASSFPIKVEEVMEEDFILPLWESFIILNPINGDVDYDSYMDTFDFAANLPMLKKWKSYEIQYGFNKLVEDCIPPKDNDDAGKPDPAFLNALKDALKKLQKKIVLQSKHQNKALRITTAESSDTGTSESKSLGDSGVSTLKPPHRNTRKSGLTHSDSNIAAVEPNQRPLIPGAKKFEPKKEYYQSNFLEQAGWE